MDDVYVRESFPIVLLAQLHLSCDTEVVLERGEVDAITVRTQGEGWNVRQGEDGTVFVSRTTRPTGVSIGSISIGDVAAGRHINIGGVNFSGMSGVDIVGGAVNISGNDKTPIFVDGVQVWPPPADPSAPPPVTPKAIITIPPGTVVTADLVDCSLYGDVEVGRLTLQAAGRSTVTMTAMGPIKATTRNSARVAIGISDHARACPVRIKTANGSTLSIHGGKLGDVTADSSNGSSIVTNGEVLGDYEADASNGSSITHVGTVHGSVSRSRSNGATINIPNSSGGGAVTGATTRLG